MAVLGVCLLPTLRPPRRGSANSAELDHSNSGVSVKYWGQYLVETQSIAVIQETKIANGKHQEYLIENASEIPPSQIPLQAALSAIA